MLFTETDPPSTATPRLTGVERAVGSARHQDTYGTRLVPGGVDTVVHAPHATAVEFCLLDGEGEQATERRFRLLVGEHGRWHGHIPGVGPGQRYGLRVHGPWDPAHGHFHNPHKLLADPYARAIVGSLDLVPAVYGHVVDDRLRPVPGQDGRDERDSAPHVPHGVIVDDHFDDEPVQHPDTPWGRTVIYEAHVRGLTQRLPGVPEHLRGTYAGLAHPTTVAHLRDLGVTAVELLPIHAKVTEPALTERGVVNYWGYNTLGYFAPEPAYATQASQAAGPAAVLAEVKGMVKLLHEAGIEVILDVVYNHTCEGGTDGPLLSWRGLDNVGYYLHDGAGHSRYLDVTGCGNSLDFRNQHVVRMTLDSLRYWAAEVGVDGFRFDLAVTMGRKGTTFLPDHPFLVALACDPVLGGRKLIAEPWDLGPGGWRTGQFTAPVAEWNDRYRDVLRTFWISDAAATVNGGHGHDLRDLATRLAGSADMFAQSPVPGGRGPIASLNFVTAHDGFTLRDLVSYDHKHNELNGEDNRDGTDNNRSWNHGVEGETDEAEILAHRRRTMRNILGTMMVSAGVPMITAGDEFGRTQHGNNNAYCHDDESVWVDWDLADWQHELRATTAHLLTLRRQNRVLRPARFRPFDPRSFRSRPALAWFDEHGATMSLERWHDVNRRVLQMFRGGERADERDALIVINGAANPVPVTLSSDGPEFYELVWDSAWEHPDERPGSATVPAGTTLEVPELSMRIYLQA
ncbi:glycogen debranching enzyme GlgX [Occultella glacieicola]|uniref:Glycogen debranching enzyme GlgX n=1 Tax=Occultella glacieicola TaxID=2518684 RepID=A0ABY2E685_9MICO|nr:glycogen debranching protein GlgX [Occultella glacieicola]TDE95989.1 glycogen debranching enzyme GlgX [Occultella glacieicola]